MNTCLQTCYAVTKATRGCQLQGLLLNIVPNLGVPTVYCGGIECEYLITHREGVEAKGLCAEHPILPLGWMDSVIVQTAEQQND